MRSLFLLGLLAIGTLSFAQNSNEPKNVTNTFLLHNAHIITHPGQMVFGSVLLRDGLIENVGPSVSAPYDAQVIDMDSMYIYAGFIDPLSHAGLQKKEKEDRPNVPNPGNPPNAVAGITPDISAYDLYQPSESSVKKLREAGFGIAHIVPEGRMLPGTGAIFSLAEGDKDALVIKKDASMFAQLKSANRVAPGTIIGVMAKMRDLYRNAEATKSYRSKYNLNPAGMRRAQADPATEALIPVVEKQMPVYFIAEKALDISRAITLQQDLGFDLVLADVAQGWPMLSKIKNGRYPILLSLDLPDEIKEEDKDKDEEMTAEEKAEQEKKKKKEEDKLSRLEKINLEALTNREERKKQSVKEYEAQAAQLEKQNVNFALTARSTKPGDIHKNLRRMIAAGLSETTALAAITTRAAEQLGISKIAGSIEAGKLANLVITDKPYFEEKSKIRYVFIDGQMNEMKKKEEKKGQIAKGAGNKLAGEWTYSIEIPGQTQGGTMKITADGDDIVIELDSNDEPGDFDEATDVSFEDNQLKFGMEIDNDGFTLSLTFDMEVEEDSMKGTVDTGQFGAFPIEATKADPKRSSSH